jgi:hypothetical protein
MQLEAAFINTVEIQFNCAKDKSLPREKDGTKSKKTFIMYYKKISWLNQSDTQQKSLELWSCYVILALNFQ